MSISPIRSQPLGPDLKRIRDQLAAVMTWGGHLPLEWRLAAISAFNELEARTELPYPPAEPGPDPAFTEDSARRLLADVRDSLVTLIGDAPVDEAFGLAYAARELRAVVAEGRR